MASFSLAIGIVFGLLWGQLFTSKLRQPARTSAWFLASSSTIRYLLLAALLALLIVKFKISLIWWAVGFFISFWIIIFAPLRGKRL